MSWKCKESSRHRVRWKVPGSGCGFRATGPSWRYQPARTARLGDAPLAVMPFGNSTPLSRRDTVKIAQRFQRWVARFKTSDPVGTAESQFREAIAKPYNPSQIKCRVRDILSVMLSTGPSFAIASRNPIFFRPSGTGLCWHRNPALERWAIVGCPSGTNFCLNSRKALGLV